jgi:DNA-directed RNA polymerase specialized sigma24 family protein
MNTINNVVSRISGKYTFPGFDADDLKQESYIICIEALDRFEDGRTLENFLSVNLSNRLKNLIRDNYCKSGEEDKKKILSPASIHEKIDIIDSNYSVEKLVSIQEMSQELDEIIPPNLRSDYLKILNGVPVSKQARMKISNIIKEHFNEKR